MAVSRRINSIVMAIALIVFFLVGAVFVRADEKRGVFVSRDPFVPLVGVDRANVSLGIESIFTATDVRFEGIVSGSDGKKALVLNGEIIGEGETIGLVKVISVGLNEAKITIDGKAHTVTLYE
jgi:hypothetical protein